ncbi:MAG: hypothetical protein KF752_07500 [Pirellulaceae bacterium]|nr:hypothetical protein [Pirellulaceae bacterium]
MLAAVQELQVLATWQEPQSGATLAPQQGAGAGAEQHVGAGAAQQEGAGAEQQVGAGQQFPRRPRRRASLVSASVTTITAAMVPTIINRFILDSPCWGTKTDTGGPTQSRVQ